MPRDVEFMHQLGGHENLDRYFQRRVRLRSAWSTPEGLNMSFELQSPIPRTSRSIQGLGGQSPTQVLAGFYQRISDTFMAYIGTNEERYLTENSNNVLIRDRLYQSALTVREDFVHDTGNIARDAALCENNNFWNIYELNHASFVGSVVTAIMCIGCGIGGSIINLSRGILEYDN